MFYRLNHFTLVLDVPMYNPWRCGVTTLHDPFWLDVLEGSFARVTKLRFIIHAEHSGFGTGGERFTRHHWSIDFLGEGTVTPLGRERSVRTDPLTLVDSSAFAAVDRELLVTVKAIVARKSFTKVQKDDLPLLRAAVDRAMPYMKSS